MKALFRAAAFALLAIPLTAQVQIVCAPSPLAYSRAIFDKRSAGAVQHWSCVLTASDQPVAVSEAAIQAWMMRQGVSALSSHAIRIGATEIKRRGHWATAGRILTYGGTITAALAAGDVIQIGAAWGAVAGFTSLQAPVLGQMLAARDPDGAIFERLAIEQDIALAPGQSVSVAMFAAPLASAKPIDGTMGAPPLVSAAPEPAVEGPAVEILGHVGASPWAQAASHQRLSGTRRVADSATVEIAALERPSPWQALRLRQVMSL